MVRPTVLLKPGQTVWRCERAERLSLLVDMADYFKAAKSAMEQARRSIYFLGWSFDPDTRFAPGEDGAGPSRDRIAAFLKHLACNRREVEVKLLIWKSALPIAASQNFFPHRARRAFRGTPVQFRLDGALPLGACHHQKAIIIDDRVAFCGGGDIAPDRWDTQEHKDDNPNRRKPRGGKFYDPRHEVMTVFDGAPAQALGDMFRERWRRASRRQLAPPVLSPEEIHGEEGDPWPKTCVEPDFRNVNVGFARTLPLWRARPESREAERLHLASIAAAKSTIYMENQYFASPIIAEALAARLAQKGGPEVVLISTQHSPSWFDQMTMDRTRLAFLKRLKDADEEGRRAEGKGAGGGKLHAYCPVTNRGKPIIVHAKLAIIDDRLLRVGSANINNRSTGFDTECDVAVEADAGPAGEATRATIHRLRTDLVAHWLGKPAPAFEEALAKAGTIAGAIEALDCGGSQRRLAPLEPEPIGAFATLIATFHLGDPGGPADSWRPWRRRRSLEQNLAKLSTELKHAGLPSPVDELSPETV